MDKNLKRELMIQSLSPLAFLTIVRNLKFSIPLGNYQSLKEMATAIVAENKTLVFIMAICILWGLAAVYSFFSFSAFKWADKRRGYEIYNVKEKEDASLNFFMTIIIPLLIDDVYTIQGALTFAIIVLLMCILLEKTSLFYANPVLAIMGYRVYTFSFVSNVDYAEKTCIGVVKGNLKDSKVSVEYKAIDENVLYIREMTK